MAVTWLAPLFVNANGASVEAGVDVAAGPRWFLRVGGDAFPVEQDFRPLLPLLQPGYGGSWHEACDRVTARLAEAGLNVGLADTFPYELPVLGADVIGSDFWLDLAEPWRAHVRDRYAVAGLRAQFKRLHAGEPGSIPLPPTPAERSRVLGALWRSLGVHGRNPAWSSGLVDAAVRWSLAEGPPGPRRLWLALLEVLRNVEPNVLHWNLFDALGAAAHTTGLEGDLTAHPPGELSGPLSIAQALLVLRFLPVEGDIGARVRRVLAGFVLPQEVDGRRYSTRFLPGELLA